MKDFIKACIMLVGVAACILGLYLLTTKVEPVVVAYISLFIAVAIILFSILIWKRK